MSRRIDRTGETRKLNNGLTATIVRYKDNKDMDVKFSDGRVMTGASYSHFKKGDLSGTNKHAKKAASERVGLTNTMKCGLEATIVEYNDSSHVRIRFSNGIERMCRYSSFTNGEVAPGEDSHETARKRAAKRYLGATVMSNVGLMIECIEYIDQNNLTVRFEDGVVRTEIIGSNFLKGIVGHPVRKKGAYLHDGEINLSYRGQMMEVVRYNSWNDIVVRFEDGTIVPSTYGQFKTGKIHNPSLPDPLSKANERIGETKMMNCGLNATVIDYAEPRGVILKFEDGTTLKSDYWAFSNGNSCHPNLRPWTKKSFTFLCFDVKYCAGQKEMATYKCVCNICKERMLLTPKQMVDHDKIHKEEA